MHHCRERWRPLSLLGYKPCRLPGLHPVAADLMDLILLPMMRHRRPMLEVVDAAVDRVGQLPREQQERAVACLAGMDPAPGTAARQLSGDTRRSVGYRH